MNKQNLVGVAITMTALLASIGVPTVVVAQGAAEIEEVLVTGRKRSESLTDVPVSISVLNETLLEEAGINSQDDLFAATPGLDFGNNNGTRTDNNPGIRGVQSELRAANQQKVASFIDGMPMNGNTSTLSFTGIDAVEVYRGPQSAAFGRSTFAGAINYVTSDSSEEFEGKVTARTSNQGGNETAIVLSGPITDSLGYRVSYSKSEWTGPDEWRSTDGYDMGAEEAENITAKLNFEFSPTAYGELSFSRLDATDRPGAGWVVDPTSCSGATGSTYTNQGTMAPLLSGAWNCSTDAPAGGLPRNHDFYDQFETAFNANLADYATAYGVADFAEFLDLTAADGTTYEQMLVAFNVDPVWNSDKDRFWGDMNFEVGDNLLQFLGMYTDDQAFRWDDNDYVDSLAVINPVSGMFGANTMTMGAIADIKETYAEVRWVSPDSDRLRYTVSATYYNYENNLKTYNNLGAFVLGQTIEAGPNAGNLVNVQNGLIASEIADNVGIGVNMNYDLTDRTTLSFEGRYQIDEVCGINELGANIELCAETKSFAPRLAINTTINENLSVYGQFSIGNNPAGVNISYLEPRFIEAMNIANGTIPVPVGVGAGAAEGVTYNGVGGNPEQVISYDATTFGAYEEEELINYEIGAKGSFADRRGAFTAAAYFMQYNGIIGRENLNWDDQDAGGWNETGWNSDLQVGTWLNQGDSEMYGIELTVDYALDDTWQVGGYVTLAEANFTDYCSIQGSRYRDSGGAFLFPILNPVDDGVLSNCSDANGNQVARHSPFTASFNASANLPDAYGFNSLVRLDVRHQGAFYEDHLNLIERSAVTTANLSLNMRSEDWTVRLFVDNLTDNDEPGRVFPARSWIENANPTVGPTAVNSWAMNASRPREIGLQVQYSF